MTRYADPQRCPDCRGPIEYGARSCPACDLPLVGATAGLLFSTLAQADELLRTLRASQVSVVPAALVPETVVPAPGSTRPSRPRGGLSAASVPKILLGLGAVCLLVAALVFLAVTWSAMGVAGRTATLVGFTAVAGALSAWMAHRNLRAAAESLALVALGLLAFDLFGAQDSGWLGSIAGADFLVLLGAVLVVAGTAAALAVRRTPILALTGAEIVGALGIALMAAGISGGDRFAFSAALVVSVVLAAAATFAAHRLRLEKLAVGAATVSGSVWLILVASSFERAFHHPTAHELWRNLEVWPLVAAAALVGALALVRTLPTSLRAAGVAVAELILAAAALIPFSQGTGTELTLAVLVLLVASCAPTLLTREPWSWGCAATTAAAGLWMVGVASMLSLVALGRIAEAAGQLWDGTPGGRLPGAFDVNLAGWLLPVAVLATVGTVVVLARAVRGVDRLVAPMADPVLGVGIVAAATIGTAALYPVPVSLVCALPLVTSAGFAGWAVKRSVGTSLAAAALFLSGALAVSLYDEWLTALALLAGLALSTVVYVRWPQHEVRLGAGFLTASSLAASIWTWGAILGGAETWTALMVLVALGLVVVALPLLAPGTTSPRTTEFVGVETGSAVSAVLATLAGVGAASYTQTATWTAIYLTVAGAVVSTTALLRADRRRLGWVGGLLLAMASWVRLWDIGVEAPEAYTVPSAVALGVVGLVHLHRNPTASTMTALAPALGLALVPSLLWVLWEPATLRSILLGAACLVLLVGGARARWTAPVVFAATVGACVVLRHAGPFVDQAVPRWVLIAAAGTVLISTGVTWERRVQDARAVAGYVRALR